MAIDISTVGATITISTASGTITIKEFSDEGTPFDGGGVTVSQNQKNLNGTMISSRTPSVYPVTLSVIPGSDADFELTELVQKSAIQPGGVSAISDIVIGSLIIDVPGIDESGQSTSRSYTYENGRIKQGPLGPGTSAQGRQSARTFQFEFESFSLSGAGKTITDGFAG